MQVGLCKSGFASHCSMMRRPRLACLHDSNQQHHLPGKLNSCCPTFLVSLVCSSEFVRSDHLLSWISSHVLLPTAHGNSSGSSGGGGGSGTSSGSSTVTSSATSAPALELSPELRRWELEFSQLEMQRACGRGSYGRVSLERMDDS